MSGHARVIIQELDLSTRVPSFPGVYGSIVIAARRGPVGVPTLVTSETQYLQRYTVNEAVEVGEDMAHFSALTFLQRSNKLWVVRPDNGAEYAGAVVKLSGLDAAGEAILDEDDAPIVPNDSFTLEEGLVDPEIYDFEDDDAFLIVNKDPGSWGHKLKITITPNLTEHATVNLAVFWCGALVETWPVSRIQGNKDGYGRSLYIEDVLKGSRYVMAVDNVVVDQEYMPTLIEPAEALEFGGGSDGEAVTTGMRILAADKWKNRDSIPLTLMLDGGNATPAYQKELILTAEQRMDCVAILSTPYEAEFNNDYLNSVIEYRKETLNAASSYAALYTPHCKIYDKFNDREIWIAPDGFVGAVISFTAAQYELWYPAAGYRRGMLPTALDVLRRYEDSEMGILYDNDINPIRFKAGKGIVIWGQKTLLGRPSRLDRLNVRMLLIVIEPAIAEALEDYIFEFNDVANRALVTAMIESYMLNIKGRNGVYDFMVVCDHTNNLPDDIDNNRMNVWLFVKPTASAEFIRFRTIITPTGVDFSQAANSLAAA